MEANWAASLGFVWRPENDGQGFHRDEHDSGGDTNWGVTAATCASAQAHGYAPEGVELAEATQLQLAGVLHDGFWNVVAGYRLPSGLDLVVFDLAMLSGPWRAAKLLQTAIGFTGRNVDGAIGPVTLGAIDRTSAVPLISMLTADAEDFFGGLATWGYFGRGWTRRAEDARKAGLMLAGGDG